MADEEQVKILKQGFLIWNTWRDENRYTNTKISFIGANLSESDLREVDLSEAYLYAAYLSGANLRRSNLSEANLCRADLSKADLSKADLSRANLIFADFSGATLCGVNLSEANLRNANLSEADLSGADLSRAILINTNLSKANLKEARMGDTMFRNTDLNETIGLETVLHESPSAIGADILKLFKGKFPVAFLRGCGLSDWEIESAKFYTPDLSNEEIVRIQYRIYELRATQALQISPLFISYSHGDSAFVDKLEKGLNAKGVRFWRDIHDLTSGRIETQIDRAIRQNPTVLLILSKNSMNSDWVQHEVRKARDLEKELGRDALCPIALDDGWKSSRWPERVMEQVMEYNILDFSKWEDESTFQAKFAKLLSGLDLFYKKSEA